MLIGTGEGHRPVLTHRAYRGTRLKDHTKLSLNGPVLETLLCHRYCMARSAGTVILGLTHKIEISLLSYIYLDYINGSSYQ